MNSFQVEDTFDGNEWDDDSFHNTPVQSYDPKTINEINGCQWVVMSDMQTPKLVREIVDHRLPRLRVGNMTLYEATELINEQWGLRDYGFVEIEGHILWVWWESI